MSADLSRPTPAVDVSVIVVIPTVLGREMLDFVQVYDAIFQSGRTAEFVFVLDGENPSAASTVLALSKTHPVTLLALAESFGRSACQREAVKRSQGKALLMLPPYEQVASAELPKLIDGLATADVVVAARDRVSDSLGNRARGWAYRKISQISGVKYRDLACEVRAVKPGVFDDVILQDGQHIFLPILAARAGYKVEEVVALQAAGDRTGRAHKITSYFDGLLNLLAMSFLIKFTYRPFRFFGGIAFCLILGGLLVGLSLLFERMVLGVALSDRPMLLVAVLLPMLGIQIGAVGLIAEIVIFTRAKTNPGFRIREIVGGQAPATSKAALRQGAGVA